MSSQREGALDSSTTGQLLGLNGHIAHALANTTIITIEQLKPYLSHRLRNGKMQIY